MNVPSCHPTGWRHPDAVAETDLSFPMLAELARLSEHGKLDAMFFQDSAAVPGSAGTVRRQAVQPAQRPPGAYRAGQRHRRAGRDHLAYRPDLDLHHQLQRAVQRRPPLPDDRPYQRRPRRLEPGDLAGRGRGDELRPRRASGPRAALRTRRGVPRRGGRAVGQLGGRRVPARQGERRVVRPPQDAHAASSREAFHRARAAERGALAAGPAGDRAGWLVRCRHGAGGAHRRHGVHRADHDRRRARRSAPRCATALRVMAGGRSICASSPA